MTVRVGINGYGRIGRSFHRALLDRGESAGVELVAVNDPFGDSETMAFLLKHDSVGGSIPNEVKVTDAGFSVDGKEIKKLDVREPAEWEIVRIPGAQLIPKGDIPAKLAELPQDKPIVLHCKTGVRSAEVLAALKNAGFSDAVHVQGGVTAWATRIDKALPTY